MNKCEWKDGKFEMCNLSWNMMQQKELAMTENNKLFLPNGFMINYCPFCGADIRKPEKPLIVKSGGTWVAHWKGVDYLWIEDGNMPQVRDQDMGDHFMRYITIKGFTNRWKPFSEITLDDEIAKLRPMVKIGNNLLVKLYGVLEETLAPFRIVGFPSYRDMYGRVTGYNYEKATLATPKELQELS